MKECRKWKLWYKIGYLNGLNDADKSWIGIIEVLQKMKEDLKREWSKKVEEFETRTIKFPEPKCPFCGMKLTKKNGVPYCPICGEIHD